MKVLITAPSLNETRNVSGISTIVRQIIDYGRSDFIHFVAGRADSEKAGLVWLAKQAVLPLKFLALIRKQKPDLVHINTALTDLSILRDAALTGVAKYAGLSIVLSLHGGKYLVSDFENSRLERITGNMLRRAKTVVVYSDYEKTRILRRWPNLNIRILPNAIPFESVPQISRDNERPVVVFFGRMHESKGLHEIIEACGILNSTGFDFEFRAYGDGPLRDFFVAEMARVLGPRFVYGGIVAGQEKWNTLGAADIFVLPSRYGEGLPMAMLEAMAVGCIVIASDVASVTTVLREGANGYVVEPDDGPGLASKMKVLLSDRFDWPTVQENAIETVKKKFDIPGYIDTLEYIYKSAIA